MVSQFEAKAKFIADVEALLDGVKDNSLSTDDFMTRVFEFYQLYESRR